MRWIFLLLAVVLVSTIVSASDTKLIVTSLDDQISFGESALYKLRIINQGRTQQKYSIYSLQSRGWNVDPQPLSDKVITLLPGKFYDTKIRAQPTIRFDPGIYSVALSIDSDNGQKQELSLKVYLGYEKPQEYLPAIKATLELDDSVSPREALAATLFLENQNALDLSNLVIKVQSTIPEFNQEIPVELLPLGTKTVEFTLRPNPLQQPKNYKVFFVFENKGETIKVLEKEITITTLLPEFTLQVEEKPHFLKKKITVMITNDGNVLNSQEVKVPISFFSSLFTNSDGEFIIIEEQRYLAWEKSLKPGEATAVEYVTDYRIILYVVLIILALAGFYAAVQSPVLIKKKAVTVKNGDDGALSEIKVTLEVRNRSKKLLKDLEVIDLVPVIANVEKSLELGTLKPKEIRYSKQGTKVVWSLPEFDVHEHRLITYNIRAKLNILGTFRLPRAEIHYGKRGNKKGKAYSNFLNLE